MNDKWPEGKKRKTKLTVGMNQTLKNDLMAYSLKHKIYMADIIEEAVVDYLNRKNNPIHTFDTSDINK